MLIEDRKGGTENTNRLVMRLGQHYCVHSLSSIPNIAVVHHTDVEIVVTTRPSRTLAVPSAMEHRWIARQYLAKSPIIRTLSIYVPNCASQVWGLPPIRLTRTESRKDGCSWCI